MGLKLLFRFINKEPITKIFEIAIVSHSNDDIAIINETVLSKILKGYKNISEGGGQFIVVRKEKMELPFCSNLNDDK
jgi:hypothetical protein